MVAQRRGTVTSRDALARMPTDRLDERRKTGSVLGKGRARGGAWAVEGHATMGGAAARPGRLRCPVDWPARETA